MNDGWNRRAANSGTARRHCGSTRRARPVAAVRRRRATSADLSLLPRIFESISWNQRDTALEHGKALAKHIVWPGQLVPDEWSLT